MKPLLVAIKGKGARNAVQRVAGIIARYGVTPGKLNHMLVQFVRTMDQYGGNATFPITLVALQRHVGIVRQLMEQGTEFAVHGYRHVDHSQLSLNEQAAILVLARQTLDSNGIQARGFRCPYLRWNPATLTALRQHGYSYDSSQGLAWNVLDISEPQAYRQALEFYRALPAEEYPSLPDLEDGLVRIPYSLPDDEALVERLKLDSSGQIAVWQKILERTYQLGELFSLGLHPERFTLCQDALESVLAQARQRSPEIWIARLDEIASWWQARAATAVEITDIGEKIHLSISGPKELAILAGGVEVDAPTQPWMGDLQQIGAISFSITAPQRPFIGVSPNASPGLSAYLQQQGYIVEINDRAQMYAHYFDWKEFGEQHKRPLLSQIESSARPTVRFGRWPNGARSALSITGDIDALTIWDYGLRFLGR